MEITIFRKTAVNKDGKPFNRYLTTLTKNTTGEAVTMGVKFRRDAGEPEVCPCNINVAKVDANISMRSTTDKNGEPVQYPTLWVSRWTPGGPYVDHSTDEYF